MIKIGFMTFSCPQWDLNEVLTAAVRYGYDSVEPRAEAGHKHGVELDTTKKQRKEIKSAFADMGVDLACIATSRQYAKTDRSELEESIELTKRYVDLAADVGSPCLRVFGGPTPEGVTLEEMKPVVAEALRECAEYAAKRGVFVCLETHDSYSHAGDAVDVVKLADHPNAVINWDIMHPCTAGQTIPEAFELVRPYVHHCHAHDGTPKTEARGWDLAPIGTGGIDHVLAMKLLAEIDYQGCISGEWINWQEPEEHLPREATTLRRFRDAVSQ